jgi:hypothetical protein
MSSREQNCPDCDPRSDSVNRRDFLKTASAAAVAVGSAPLWAPAAETASAGSSPETVVKSLYESLKPEQKQQICFDWDYKHPERGLLRTHVSNFWHITEPVLTSDFYTKDQQALLFDIFKGVFNPDWHERFLKQLKDDHGGKTWGTGLSCAIFGKPGTDQFEFVMTGRHMTLRCDGNSTEHVAFGGPIFYGHAASGFNEKPNHPGNVFWHQALAANKVFEMLDEKQRKHALIDQLPREEDSGFRSSGDYPGIRVSEMSSDQKGLVQEVLQKLIDPYRQTDRDEVVSCLKAQGGLDKCSLAFYRDGDIGDDKVWDCWRLEGPSFVWYYRGAPHVHVWVNVADSPNVAWNA